MDGYYAGYADYEVSIAGNPNYDFTDGSDGCHGLIKTVMLILSN